MSAQAIETGNFHLTNWRGALYQPRAGRSCPRLVSRSAAVLFQLLFSSFSFS